MQRLLNRIVKAIDSITWLQIAVAGAALFGVLAVNLVGVIMRYIVRSPIPFSVELPSLLMVLIIGLALAYAQKEKAHVKVTALTMHMPATVRNVLNAVTGVLFSVYVAFIAWGTWSEAYTLLRAGIRSTEARIPMFLPVMFIPIGLGVFCLQIMLGIWRDFSSPNLESKADQDHMMANTGDRVTKDQ